MAEDPVPGQDPKIMSLHFPGGGMGGIQPLAVLARVEELTGKPVSDLFQNMEGGSVASFLIAGMNTRKSNDPNDPSYNDPRYTMREGLKLFIDETPKVFPHVPNREIKMLIGQNIDVQNEWIDGYNKPPLECKTEGFMAKLCNGFNTVAVGALTVEKAFLSATQIPANYVRENWAKDFMYDPKDLEALYKKVLGEDTRLSDVRGTIHLPVYNMTTQQVQYFTVEKKDLMDAASGNAVVSHGDPKLWEVAMAATANNLAYKPYIMGDQVYFDGAMFHEPTTHLDLAKKPGGPEVVLVDLAVVPANKGSIPDMMHDSKIFNSLVDVMHEDMKPTRTPEDLERMSKVFGSAVHGFTEGGLTHVRNYVEYTAGRNAERDNFAAGDGNVIRIAPPPLKPNENPDSVPSPLDAFKADDKSINKQIDYTKRTLEDRDPQIRALALELVANQVRRGEMSLEEYNKIKADIESSDYEDSTVPEFLDGIRPGQLSAGQQYQMAVEQQGVSMSRVVGSFGS